MVADIQKLKKVKALRFAKPLYSACKALKKKFHILPKVPPTVYVELTDVCNLNCVMCDRDGMTRKSGFMSMELFKRIVDNAVEIKVPVLKLNRFGESMLHPRLMEMIRYAKDRGVPWVYFTSNGTLLTEEKARGLINSGLDSITFSFDGSSRETYENIRVNAKYEQVRDNIMTLIKMRNDMGRDKPRVVINTILSKDTEEEIYGVFELWAAHADKINVLPVGRYGNVEDLTHVERGEREKVRPCHQLFDRLLIFWDGTATVCCADIDGALSVGNFNDSSIEDLWHSEAFNELRRKHLDRDLSGLPTCRMCDSSNALHYERILKERKQVYKRAAELGFYKK